VVGVRLVIRDDRITLRVADNGRGFEVGTTSAESFGLVAMRQRAALIGGRIRIASTPESGTRIVLTAPFARPPELVGSE
jgi:signal transduction histidine kinase